MKFSRIRRSEWFFLFLPLLLLNLSCNPEGPDSQEGQIGLQEWSVENNPEAAGRREVPGLQSQAEGIQPLVSIDPSYRLVDVYQSTTDYGPLEIQVLILEDLSRAAAPLLIQVVDYDPNRQSHYVSWERLSTILPQHFLSVHMDDLIGNFTQEIILRGTDPEDRQRLEIYRPNLENNITTGYTPILNLSSRGSIEITPLERDSAYQSRLLGGISYPIEVTEPDPTSTNQNELVRRTFEYVPSQGAYLVRSQERISNDQALGQQLQNLIAGGLPALTAFLEGPWYPQTPTGDVRDTSIFFDYEQRQIILFTDEEQEVYSWTNTTRTLRNALYIVAVNDIFPSTRIQFSVSVINGTDINLVPQSNIALAGVYRRIPQGLQQNQINSRDRSQFLGPEIQGLYRNNQNWEINFELPRFQLTEGENQQSGSAVFFQFVAPLLQLKFINENGLIQENRYYEYEHTEQIQGQRIVRTLVLRPVQLSVDGLVREEQFIELQQIELTP